MTSAPLPLGLEVLADQPSLAPRGLVATGRALGIAGAVLTGVGAASLAWGSLERRLPVLRRLTIDVPAHRGIAPLSILHVSDLHLYPGQEFLVDFLHEVAAAERIDLVVSTGDNFGLAEGLELVEAAYEPLLDLPGVFVLGSNDYYSARRKAWGSYLLGASKPPTRTIPDIPWTAMTKRFRDAGWLDLSNRAGALSVPLRGESGGEQVVSFLGTDDAHINRDRIVDPEAQWASDSTLRLGVTHAPYTRVLNAMTTAGADLVLAGHTHGGQIGIPGFGAIITNCDIDRRYAKGLHRWTSGTRTSLLHVSAGLGTSPFAPIRIATRPEATLLTIRSV
ncbi:metallophosphoesterase [Actinomyces culturomici]|uniref:metallophosphoesterase n=1 Tax=Actinomyces culturomici TaxID=1926276 RepID=UPI000E204932|nr:metallophosphoesterase [Actinomyces culturomici]